MIVRDIINRLLNANLTASNLPQAVSINSSGKAAAAVDPYTPADGIVDSNNAIVTADESAAVIAPGPVVRLQAGSALTAGTHRLLMKDSNGNHVPLTAGGVVSAIWLPNTNESGVSLNAADGAYIDAVLIPEQPRAWVGTATILAAADNVIVAVDAAFNGNAVIVSPSGGFDVTATTFHGSVAAGSLTITANAAATADTDVAYYIDGGS